jgi:uncharacterized protein YbjT (DUF2867 family)
MHILLCGADGFIGRHLEKALRREGHRVTAAVSARSRRAAHTATDPVAVVDFARDTQAATWLPRLHGIDAVVNAVGVLRDTPARPIDAVHARTPIALFDACADAGVRRVVHIAALGIDDSASRYAETKRAAESHLLALDEDDDLDAVSLRPSIVFGRGGASSALFVALARLPILPLPGRLLDARIQPVSVHDVADAVASLLDRADGVRGIVECGGPESLTVAEFIASLRYQLGLPAARVVRLSDRVAETSARVGDRLPGVPWCSDTLAMLATDNVVRGEGIASVTGRAPTHYRELLTLAWK